MKLNRTLQNLRETKENFFNLEDKSELTFDLLKKNLTYFINYGGKIEYFKTDNSFEKLKIFLKKDRHTQIERILV